MTCNDWIERLSRLRSDRSAARWPASTLHRAPHKPLMLLSVLDLIAQGEAQANFFDYGPDLINVFDLYWGNCSPRGFPMQYCPSSTCSGIVSGI